MSSYDPYDPTLSLYEIGISKQLKKKEKRKKYKERKKLKKTASQQVSKRIQPKRTIGFDIPIGFIDSEEGQAMLKKNIDTLNSNGSCDGTGKIMKIINGRPYCVDGYVEAVAQNNNTDLNEEQLTKLICPDDLKEVVNNHYHADYSDVTGLITVTQKKGTDTMKHFSNSDIDKMDEYALAQTESPQDPIQN
jgi:hypothetical protein